MYKYLILSIFIFLLNNIGLNAQSLKQIIEKRSVISTHAKLKQPYIRSLTAELSIQTPKGEVPARLQILENIGYKLEILTKTNRSAEIMNLFGLYYLSENGKIEKVINLDMNEYIAKKGFLIINELEMMTRGDYPHERVEVFGNMDDNQKPCQAFKIRSDNPEIWSELYFDIEKFNLYKKKINYPGEDGQNITEEFTYNNYKSDKETLLYPYEFSTKFGLAKVKSIKVNLEIIANTFDPKN